MNKEDISNSIKQMNFFEKSEFLDELGNLFGDIKHENKDIVKFTYKMIRGFEDNITDKLDGINIIEKDGTIKPEFQEGTNLESKKDILSRFMSEEDVRTFEVVNQLLTHDSVTLSNYLDSFSENHKDDNLKQHKLILTDVETIDKTISREILKIHRLNGTVDSNLYINQNAEIQVGGRLEGSNEFEVLEINSLDIESQYHILEILNDTYHFAGHIGEELDDFGKNYIDYYHALLIVHEGDPEGVELQDVMPAIKTEETKMTMLSDLQFEIIRKMIEEKPELGMKITNDPERDLIRDKASEAVDNLIFFDQVKTPILYPYSLHEDGFVDYSETKWSLEGSSPVQVMNELFEAANMKDRMLTNRDKLDIVGQFPEGRKLDTAKKIKGINFQSEIEGLERNENGEWNIDSKNIKKFLGDKSPTMRP